MHGTTRVSLPNDISFRPTVLAGCTECDRQHTDRRTDRPRYGNTCRNGRNGFRRRRLKYSIFWDATGATAPAWVGIKTRACFTMSPELLPRMTRRRYAYSLHIRINKLILWIIPSRKKAHYNANPRTTRLLTRIHSVQILSLRRSIELNITLLRLRKKKRLQHSI